MSFPTECLFNLWRMRNTILEMLEVRGCDLKSIKSEYGSQPQVVENWDDWKTAFIGDRDVDPFESVDGKKFAEYRQNMTIRFSTKVGKGIVFWYPSDKLGINDIENLEKQVAGYSICILVLLCYPSSSARDKLNEIRETGMIIDQFHDEELFSNITKHPLVSKHVVCSDQEKKEIFEKYYIGTCEGDAPAVDESDKLEITVSEPWFTFIREGRKTVEGRKNNPPWSNIKSGDVLQFKGKGGESASAKVTDVKRYKNLDKYFAAEGLETTLPNVEDVQAAKQVYMQWSTAEEIAKNGFLGIHFELIPQDDGLPGSKKDTSGLNKSKQTKKVPPANSHPKMQWILLTDPVCKFIGGRRDQVIKVYRPSWTQILPNGKKLHYISYRYVVEE